MSYDREKDPMLRDGGYGPEPYRATPPPEPREPAAREAVDWLIKRGIDPDAAKILAPDFEAYSAHTAKLFNISTRMLLKEKLAAEAYSAELRAERDKAKDANHRAFVAGAKWWEFSRPEGGTMWPSDQHLIAEEAAKRWPYVESVKVLELRASLMQAREAKDGAYAERDNLVAALSKLFPSALERHPDSDTTWENDWRWIVFIDLPTGQATWHIHDSELAMFDHLPRFTGRTWDGHTTPQKYLRLAASAPEGTV